VKVLVVPATSAPVERAFSSGSMSMRPRRARLSQTKLSRLVYLKCNIDKLQCGCIMAAINFRNSTVLSVLDVDVIVFYKHNKLQ